MDEEDIEKAAEWDGENGEFFNTITAHKSKFIDRINDVYVIHDWREHQPHLIINIPGERLPKVAWIILRKEILKRDNYTCQYCGAVNVKLECDHIIPISKGGDNSKENLTTACVPCNRSKYNKSKSEWLQ
jgi:hypothetical protein